MHFYKQLASAVLILQFLQATILAYNNDYNGRFKDYVKADTAATTAEDILDLSKPSSPAEQKLRLWLTINAQKRFLEVSWQNAPAHIGDNVLLTKQQPYKFEKIHLVTETPLAAFDNEEASGGGGGGRGVAAGDLTEGSGGGGANIQYSLAHAYKAYNFDNVEASGFNGHFSEALSYSTTSAPAVHDYWVSNNGLNDIVASIKPSLASQWFTTGVPFDYELSRNVTIHTGCYGYWASYIDLNGSILASACIRAFPRWMHDLHSIVADLRIRDIFIPGTHDSGSYRPNFDPLLRETLVTKYALTQDDDIRGQLMHGVRYLDIRVGYYRNTNELFFINHGITRQRPLAEIIDQVKDFVLETNEIVIFGLKEFPVGFGKNLGVHRLLVNFLQEKFGDLIVHPSLSWRASLRDIWSRKQNVILAYDKSAVVQEFPQTLFNSVEQRWGNVQNWERLKRHLKAVNTFDVSRLSSRPVADMAELTPDTWGVILDKHGGLRKMADSVNWRVSQLYRDELGEHANIVAVDFIRGTNLMEIAIDWNKRKVIY